MNLTVVAFYEDHWMPPGTDRAQWDHMCRAYEVELQMVRSWEEVVLPEDAKVVILEEAGDSVFPVVDGNVVLVVGRTAQNLLTYLPEGTWHGSYAIKTPQPIPMFGVSAAAIVLHQLRGV